MLLFILTEYDGDNDNNDDNSCYMLPFFLTEYNDDYDDDNFFYVLPIFLTEYDD